MEIILDSPIENLVSKANSIHIWEWDLEETKAVLAKCRELKHYISLYYGVNAFGYSGEKVSVASQEIKDLICLQMYIAFNKLLANIKKKMI